MYLIDYLYTKLAFSFPAQTVCFLSRTPLPVLLDKLFLRIRNRVVYGLQVERKRSDMILLDIVTCLSCIRNAIFLRILCSPIKDFADLHILRSTPDSLSRTTSPCTTTFLQSKNPLAFPQQPMTTSDIEHQDFCAFCDFCGQTSMTQPNPVPVGHVFFLQSKKPLAPFQQHKTTFVIAHYDFCAFCVFCGQTPMPQPNPVPVGHVFFCKAKSL